MPDDPAQRHYAVLEGRILQHLAARAARGATPVDLQELARDLGEDQSRVAAAVAILVDFGEAALSDGPTTAEYKLGPKSEEWGPDGASPERAVARAVAALGGSATIEDLSRQGIDQKLVGESIRRLAARNWARKAGPALRLADAWAGAAERPTDDELLVAHLKQAGKGAAGDLAAKFGASAIDLLQSLHPRLLVLKERRSRLVAPTGRGLAAAAAGITIREQVNELTTDLIFSGRWREVDFRPYDLALPGPPVTGGKEHPMRRILETTRRVFLELGFEETLSPWVESAFWDFDALFQPQDHPARDMQDTFYLARPERCGLPADELVDRVRRTHEDGGDTGSTGWRTPWRRDLAEKCVLRTHTTAATIRALADDPRPPRKVFCVGPVFRREAIDFKHLPVFHQVDGIVIDDGASFAALLTLLAEFYRKMGFDRVQFRPAFFPYTEPSVEAFVWMESRGEWVEMGGAGVFRPEVTEPLGCRAPVLAWGLGLERVAMFRFGRQDIRDLYLAHLQWLKETPLCRW